MNHLCALPRQSGSRWDYTRNRRATGYCCEARLFTEADSWLSAEMRDKENARIEKNLAKYHTDGHETEAEAKECYKQYLLDNQLFLTPKSENPQQLNRCQVCKEFCSGHARIGGYQIVLLCEEHCNRVEVEKLLTVDESWES